MPLLATEFTVTTTFPGVAPTGTAAVILVALHELTDATVPLNVTVLLPCVDPKLLPEMLTEVPTAPDVGDTPLMIGAEEAVTVKLPVFEP